MGVSGQEVVEKGTTLRVQMKAHCVSKSKDKRWYTCMSVLFKTPLNESERRADILCSEFDTFLAQNSIVYTFFCQKKLEKRCQKRKWSARPSVDGNERYGVGKEKEH